MWQLRKVTAKSLCAFKQLDYTLLQQHTTLIFGNNMDNDSQGSNGSGKSAMLEAIAIGLTGEPLRKIKMDEIINDSENEATVSLLLYNDSTGQFMFIDRELSRKSPQVIKISFSKNIDGDDAEGVEQATVADYNKFILEALGLTKDDIFSNFILSKHKYSSFLSSSDREKKEIINRFSNGILVDDSIAALQEDIMPIQQALQDAETQVAVANGRVEALQEQINTAITESTERSQKKSERIAGWKEAIANKRSYIREQNQNIEQADKALKTYNEYDELLQQTEESNASISVCYKKICEHYPLSHLTLPKDYASLSVEYQQQLSNIEKQYKDICKQSAKQEKALEVAQKAYSKLQERFGKFNGEYDKKAEKIQKQIDTLLTSIKKLENENGNLKSQQATLVQDIANIEKQLAGVIECPKCHFEFTLANDIDIADARLKLQDRQGEVEDITQTISTNQQKIEEYTSTGRKVRTEQNELLTSKAEWSAKITDAQTETDRLTREVSSLQNQAQALQGQISTLQKSIDDARVNLFDEAFDILDAAIKAQENAKRTAKTNIVNAEGAILSYEESIRDAEHSSENNLIDNLKASKKKYEKELEAAISHKEDVERELHAYKQQEATFVEFKTHLANSKIDALSHITNEFLEKIGSDIRIAFSGFTVLKSGKVRDKISISLIRDGVDCGSFDKFSEGEKARVNLANILAMHKLTNINCDDEKGLDLLVLDEILEATDEQGLSNIFDALNQLQITSLVVSHGNIAEGYPYKTVVNKLNGVSYINEQQR